MKSGKTFRNERGQAAIEAALALPFLVFLLYYMVNTFHSIHTAHIGQKYAAMNLYQRLANRAQFSVDSLDGEVHGREFMAVEFLDADGSEPKRRIISERGGGATIRTYVGICKDAGGKCAPE